MVTMVVTMVTTITRFVWFPASCHYFLLQRGLRGCTALAAGCDDGGIGMACAAIYCLLQEEVASNMCELIQSTTLRQELRVAALYVGNMDAGNVMGRGPVNQFHKCVRFARSRVLLDVWSPARQCTWVECTACGHAATHV